MYGRSAIGEMGIWLGSECVDVERGHGGGVGTEGRGGAGIVSEGVRDGLLLAAGQFLAV